MYKSFTKLNLLFIFIFLNIWDFALNRTFFNGMLLGAIMFGPIVLLWFIGTIRSVVLLTLISIFEFVMMMSFIFEGVELSGLNLTLKSIFWLPFLLTAGLNGFWGLRIYAKHRDQKLAKVGKKKK